MVPYRTGHRYIGTISYETGGGEGDGIGVDVGAGEGDGDGKGVGLGEGPGPGGVEGIGGTFGDGLGETEGVGEGAPAGGGIIPSGIVLPLTLLFGGTVILSVFPHDTKISETRTTRTGPVRTYTGTPISETEATVGERVKEGLLEGKRKGSAPAALEVGRKVRRRTHRGYAA